MLKRRVCNVENMTKLYNALISGQYPQARNRLRVSSRFCCLGVACEISGLGHWITDSMKASFESYVIGDTVERYELPPQVAKWLGLRGRGGDRMSLIFRPVRHEGYSSATQVISGLTMNDGGKSFQQIAEMIKEVYL